MTPEVRNKREGMPAGIYIGRPSKWGNPFKAENGDFQSHAEAVRRYREWLTHEAWETTENGPGWVYTNPLMYQLEELRGKDLVCWCTPLPCHGDVLLELANE